MLVLGLTLSLVLVAVAVAVAPGPTGLKRCRGQWRFSCASQTFLKESVPCALWHLTVLVSF